MDDISEKINRLLSSPDGMAKIQSVMASLGATGGDLPPISLPVAEREPPVSANALTAALQQGSLPDLSLLQKALPLVKDWGKDDDDTRLLYALRPYLQGEREKRLDEAVQLLRLARLIPLLQTGLGGSKGE